MFFGFTHYFPGRKGSGASVTPERVAPAGVTPASVSDIGDAPSRVAAEPAPSQAQIYDLAHQRRLRALQSYIEQGYSLNEAARLIGVSQLTVHRWDDHGRR